MANDLQLQMSTDIGKALAGINSVDARIKQLEKSIVANNRAAQEFQKHTSHSFKGAAEQADSLGNKLRHTAHAIALAGGEMGHVSHIFARFGRVANDGHGTLTRIAAVAGIAGVAFEAYNMVVEANIERVKLATEYEEKHAEAILRSNEAAGKHAISGLSQADTVRKLVGQGGHKALMIADSIADSNKMDIEDARKGVLKSLRVQNVNERTALREAALEFFRSGAGSFEQGIDEILKHPAALGAVRGDDTKRAAAIAREHALGSRLAPGNVEALEEAQQQVSASRFLAGASEATSIDNQIKASEADRVSSGEAAGEKRKELAEARDPLSAALVQLNLNNERQNRVQEEVAKALTGLSKVLDQLNPSGVGNTLRRRQNAQARAEFGGTTDEMLGNGE